DARTPGDGPTVGRAHGQFAALRILLNAGRGERTGGVGQHCPDRLNEALSVAQRYPELFEIAFRQLRQHIAVDRVLDEALGVPFQADRCEPLGNAFHGTSRRLRAMGRSNTIGSVLLTVIMYLRARSDWKAINSLFRGCCQFSPRCNTGEGPIEIPSNSKPPPRPRLPPRTPIS